MSTFKGTPGPWSVLPDNADYYVHRQDRPASGATMCARLRGSRRRASATTIASRKFAPMPPLEIVDFMEGQRGPIASGSNRHEVLAQRASFSLERFETILAALREGGAL